MHNIYINKLDVIYKIALIMKDKMKPLINVINTDRFIMAKANIAANDLTNADIKEQTIAHYLKNIHYKKGLFTQLTEREFECLLFLLEGKSAKVIASIMNISKRTVEVHFYNIKKKMLCRSRTELISKIIKDYSLN